MALSDLLGGVGRQLALTRYGAPDAATPYWDAPTLPKPLSLADLDAAFGYHPPPPPTAPAPPRLADLDNAFGFTPSFDVGAAPTLDRLGYQPDPSLGALPVSPAARADAAAIASRAAEATMAPERPLTLRGAASKVADLALQVSPVGNAWLGLRRLHDIPPVVPESAVTAAVNTAQGRERAAEANALRRGESPSVPAAMARGAATGLIEGAASTGRMLSSPFNAALLAAGIGETAIVARIGALAADLPEIEAALATAKHLDLPEQVAALVQEARAATSRITQLEQIRTALKLGNAAGGAHLTVDGVKQAIQAPTWMEKMQGVAGAAAGLAMVGDAGLHAFRPSAPTQELFESYAARYAKPVQEVTPRPAPTPHGFFPPPFDPAAGTPPDTPAPSGPPPVPPTTPTPPDPDALAARPAAAFAGYAPDLGPGRGERLTPRFTIQGGGPLDGQTATLADLHALGIAIPVVPPVSEATMLRPPVQPPAAPPPTDEEAAAGTVTPVPPPDTPPSAPPSAAAPEPPPRAAQLQALQAQLQPLLKAYKDQGGGFTRPQAEAYRGLMRQVTDLHYDPARVPTPEQIGTPESRKSTLPVDVVLTARQDLMRAKPIYDAVSDAAAGVFFNAPTAVDDIVNGKNPQIAPEDLYRAFDATRAALRNTFGDTLTLYRAEGKQGPKATTNWATTRAYAEQFGPNVVERQIPVDRVLAVNVGPKGRYHEVIVGPSPTAVFAFHQPTETGGAFPMYHVQGGPLHRSTVSADTLRAHGIDIPATPAFTPPPAAAPAAPLDPFVQAQTDRFKGIRAIERTVLTHASKPRRVARLKEELTRRQAEYDRAFEEYRARGGDADAVRSQIEDASRLLDAPGGGADPRGRARTPRTRGRDRVRDAAPRPDRVARETDSHWPTVLAEARADGFAGTDDALRAAYDANVASLRRLIADANDLNAQHSHASFLDAILRHGGLKPFETSIVPGVVAGTATTRFKVDELRDINEGLRLNWGMLTGIARNAGKSLDDMRDVLVADGWPLTSTNDLLDRLTDISRATPGADEIDTAQIVPLLANALGVRPGNQWWPDEAEAGDAAGGEDGDTSFDVSAFEDQPTPRAQLSAEDLADQIVAQEAAEQGGRTAPPTAPREAPSAPRALTPAERRAQLFAEMRADLEPKPAAGDGPKFSEIPPGDRRKAVAQMVTLIDSYIEEGVTAFADVVKQFHAEFPGARQFDRALELAWQARRGETHKVADVVPAAKPPAPTPAPRPSIGDEPVGFGKYGALKVKDLLAKDPSYVAWLVDNATGKRAVAVVNYLKADPEFLASRQQTETAAADVVTPQIVDTFQAHGITVTPEKSGAVFLSGRTFDWKDAIKAAGGRFAEVGTEKGWRMPAAQFEAFAKTVAALPRPEPAAPTVPGGTPKKSAGIAQYLIDPTLKAKRAEADATPDRSGFTAAHPESAYVSPETAKVLIEGGRKIGMPQVVVEEQVEDVARIVRAYDHDKGLFLLASEPGSGKTFVLGGAIKELQARGAKAITYVTLRQELITQIQRDLTAFGITDVHFVTYPAMREADVRANDVLIFDEAHSVKNVGEGDEGAAQAQRAAEWIGQAKMTILASATPFENPVQMAYLAPTGLFDGFKDFDQFAKTFGASTTTIGKGDYKRSILVWKRTPTADIDAAAARGWLLRQGIYTSRPIRLPAKMVDSRLVKMEAPAAHADRYKAFSEAAASIDLQGFARQWVVNFQKRLLEASKVQQGIVEAKAALARGRYPIIFVETKAERILDIPDLIQREHEWQQAVNMALMQRDKPPARSEYELPPSGIVEVLSAYMDKTGEKKIEIPSAEDLIKQAFDDKVVKVAIFTGSVTPKKAQQNLDAWRSGTKPVLVATMAKGGTGLSLHDKVGDHQTTQININLPWTASGVVQVAQRSARYGLKGRAEMQWVFATNIPFDRALAAKVGGRMADLGSVVQGKRLQHAAEIEDFDFEHNLFSEAALDDDVRNLETTPATETAPEPATATGRVVTFRSGNQTSPTDIEGYIRAGKPVGIVAHANPRVRAQAVEYAQHGGPVFVDSGAFGHTAVEADGTGRSLLDFDAVLSYYATLLGDVGEAHAANVWIVAPDVAPAFVDHKPRTFPQETRDVQRQYRDSITGLIDSGAHVIVPVQFQAARFVEDVLATVRAFPGAQLGLPGNKGAVPPDVLAAAMKALKAAGLGDAFGGAHFLGVGDVGRAKTKLDDLVASVRTHFPDALITSDSTRTTAGIGEGRPLTAAIDRQVARLKGSAADDAVLDYDLSLGMAGQFYRGEWEKFTDAELARLFEAAGVTPWKAWRARRETQSRTDPTAVERLFDKAGIEGPIRARLEASTATDDDVAIHPILTALWTIAADRAGEDPELYLRARREAIIDVEHGQGLSEADQARAEAIGTTKRQQETGAAEAPAGTLTKREADRRERERLQAAFLDKLPEGTTVTLGRGEPARAYTKLSLKDGTVFWRTQGHSGAAMQSPQLASEMGEEQLVEQFPDAAALLFDRLDTGEVQTRLPGAEGARKVGKADVTFKAPQQASGDDFDLTQPMTAEAEARAAAEERAKSPSLFEDDLADLRDEKKGGPLFALKPEKEPPGYDVLKPHLSETESQKLKADTAARLVETFENLPVSEKELEAVAQAGGVARGWYRNANRAILDVFGPVDAPRFIALASALSPRIGVRNSFINAAEVWRRWRKADRPTSPAAIHAILAKAIGGEASVLDAWPNNVVRALSADDPLAIVLSGPKVHSFYRNLLGDMQEVTNDSWMAAYADLDQKVFAGEITPSGRDPGKGAGYLAFAIKVRRAAENLSRTSGQKWTPAEVQETIWSWIRTLGEMSKATGESAEAIVKRGDLSDELIREATVTVPDLFAHDAEIRGILERAGYGLQLNALRDALAETAGGHPDGPAGGRAGAGGEDAGARRALIGAARRFDARRARQAELGEDEPLFSRIPDKAPPFYSALARTVSAKMPLRATPAQVLDIVRGPQSGVKAEELKWSGLEGWLGEQPGSVTRADVEAFLAANNLQVTETELGAPPNADAVSAYNEARAEEDRLLAERVRAKAAHDRARQHANRHEDDPAAIAAFKQTQAAEDRAESLWRTARNRRDALAPAAARAPTRYNRDGLTLPGGYEPRELLLTLPPATPVGPRVPDGAGGLVQATKGGPDFFGTHYQDTPNILAWVRFSDRLDTDGKRTLFVEEIQSDWHQKGRKVGYRNADRQAEYDAAVKRMRDLEASARGVIEAHDRLGFEGIGQAIVAVREHAGPFEASQWVATEGLTPPERETLETYRAAYRAAAELSPMRGVPDAPFKTTWPELAMKRVIRYAAEHGYDRIGWTTGEQQNARYDLSKHIQELRVEGIGGPGERLYVLTAKTPQGTKDLGAHAAAKLPDVIGKEMAEKILASPEKIQIYQGLDLKVGGRGMRGFYDDILPRFVNKYAKPWGARASTATFNVSGMGTDETEAPLRTGQWVAWGADERPIGAFPTEAEAREAADAVGGDYAREAVITAHSLDVTPAMRASVLAGQPLFAEQPGLDFAGTRAAAERTAATNRRLYETLGVPQSFAGTPGVFLDTGGRLTSKETNAVLTDPDFQHAAGETLAVLHDLIGEILGAERGAITRTGVVFDDQIYGVYVQQPGTRGLDKRATILLNLPGFMDGHTPQEAADIAYVTAAHEALHHLHPFDGPAFERHLARTLADLGAAHRATATARILDAYADPANPAEFRRGLSDVLQRYTASRGRRATTSDPLRAPSGGAEGLAVEPGAEGQPSGGAGPGGGRTVTVRELEQLAERNGSTVAAERARALRAGYDVHFAVIPGAKAFIEDDLTPVAKGVGQVLTDLKNLISPQSASPRAQSAADLVREAKARSANAQTIEIAKYQATRAAQLMAWLQRHPIPVNLVRHFDARSDDDNIAAISHYERTGDFPAGAAPAGYGHLYHESMTLARNLLLDAYGEVGYVDNYIRRQYEFGSDADTERGMAYLLARRRALSANRSPTRHRILDMPLDDALAEMRARGIEVKPTTTNPEILREWSLANAHQAAAMADAWRGLKAGGLVKWVPAQVPGSAALPVLNVRAGGPRPGRPPAGWVPINERGAAAFYPKERGLGQYYADPNVARVLNNAVSKGLSQYATYQGLRNINNALNQLQLGLSAFHATGSTLNAGLVDLSTGLRRLSHGDITGTFGVARSLSGGVLSMARFLYEGRAFIEGLKHDDPEAYRILTEQLNPAGGRLQIDTRYRSEMATQMVRAFRRGNVWGAAWRLPFAAVETVAAPLMSYAIPRIKLGVLLDRFEQFQASHPTATRAELHRGYAAISDQVDNIFGLLVYDNGFWDKTSQDLAQVMTRSVGWTGGSLRWGVGAGSDLMRMARAGLIRLPGADRVRDWGGWQWQKDPFEVSDRVLDALLLPFYVGMVGAVYMYLHTGKRPETLLDYYYPQNGRIGDDGKPSRSSLPTYMKDVAAYGSDPFATLLHKISPLAELTAELSQNEDYWGDMIRDPHDPLVQRWQDIGRHVASEALPFSITQGTKAHGQGGGPLAEIEAFTGFPEAPRSVTQTAAEKLMRSYSPTFQRTPTQKARAQLRGEIRQGVRRDTPEGTAQAEAAANTGELTRSQIRSAYKAAGRPSFVEGVKGLTLDQAIEVYQISTPEERGAIRHVLVVKRGDIKRTAPNDRADVTRRWAEVMELPYTQWK